MTTIIQQINANVFEQINLVIVMIVLIFSVAWPIRQFVKSDGNYPLIRVLRTVFFFNSFAVLFACIPSFAISYINFGLEKSVESFTSFNLTASLYMLISLALLATSLFLTMIMEPRRPY